MGCVCVFCESSWLCVFPGCLSIFFLPVFPFVSCGINPRVGMGAGVGVLPFVSVCVCANIILILYLIAFFGGFFCFPLYECAFNFLVAVVAKQEWWMGWICG
jgi:hypothetical protein